MIHGLRTQLAEAGKIKIGRKGEEKQKTDGSGTYRRPEKLDHFLITKTRRAARGDNLILDAELMEACPKDPDGKIRAIPIALHSDEIDEVFLTRYAWYASRRAQCTGDGRKNSKGGDCPCDKLNPDKKGNRQCKPNGTLHCTITIPGHATTGAVHKWRTTSIISIERMFGSLRQVQRDVGALRGVPLWLVVAPVQTEKAEVYCCHIECREQDLQRLQVRLLLSESRRKATADGDLEAYRAIIREPGVGETDDEQADVADEFYPPVVDAELEPTPDPAPPAKQDKAAFLAEIEASTTAAERTAIYHRVDTAGLSKRDAAEVIKALQAKHQSSQKRPDSGQGKLI